MTSEYNKTLKASLDELLKNSSILVVHGKTQNLADVARSLKSHAGEVYTHSSPDETIPSNIDLLLIEYSVLDMNGILFYKKVLETPEMCLVPAIFISDTKSYDHRLNAFEMGAADFISRPFEKQDLLKKCHVHIQNRRRIFDDRSIHVGNLSLYPETENVVVAGENLTLTQLEYKILHYLLSTPRQVVTRTEIYENVWGQALSSTGRLDTQLYNLKKKLTKFSGKIKSVNKVGMRILTSESTFSQESKKGDLQSQPPAPRP